MFGLGTTELIIILVIVMVVFGAGKLPTVMKDLGRGVKSFKSAMNEGDNPQEDLPAPTTIEGTVPKKKTE
ncbi:MAG: twin-arginine translocase TatA/TatE family subunit [Magnetococcales bacterium]|nr:twin-arginine translocase TatA/TatE family subunit [Magnetococcales bacterium]MBF0157617.1 twin-arginine translocase TatA/TatE family subunit [Magnetococcales bacterium]